MKNRAYSRAEKNGVSNPGKPEDPGNYVLALPEGKMNVILEGLSCLPWGKVAHLIPEIVGQLQAQRSLIDGIPVTSSNAEVKVAKEG